MKKFCSSAAAIATIMLIAALAAPFAQAQTFQVLHSFIGGSGGDRPYGAVSLDAAGNVYGTTFYGGYFGSAECHTAPGCGIVFKLNPAGQQMVVYSFKGRGSGDAPSAGLVRDAQGNLYGDTYEGGDTTCNPPYGCGLVFKIGTTGRETVLYQFKGGNDGANPQSTLILDAAGNLYGTTVGGGPGNQGTVFKIDPAGNETVLHAFQGRLDGGQPLQSVVMDSQGNLYGSTEFGGTGKSCANSGCGVVYKVSSTGQETILYNFSGGADGSEAGDAPTLDSEGNLYGTTGLGGDLSCFKPFGCGVIFKIDPAGNESVLFTFTDESTMGYNPLGGVVRDAAGNLYGTTYRGGANAMGTVFKLDTAGNETILHSFTGGADGAYPNTSLTMDAAGNLYGTTPVGGRPGCSGQGCGVVFKITP